MVSPVTGPIITEIGGVGEPFYYSYKVGWKQSKPIDQPLPYERRVGTVKYQGASQKTNARHMAGWDIIGGYVGSWAPLEGQAYDRLKNKISDRANWAVNLAEANQSLTMVRTRLVQLAQFGRKLIRGNFVGAASVLRMSAIPKGVSVKKSFADNYLEFHFGWAPAIADIYSSIDVLQNPIKGSSVRVKVQEPEKRYDLEPPLLGSNPSAWYPNDIFWKSYRFWRLNKTLRMGVEVAVDNPNLWLANQLGLVNPAVFLYEKFPFSFLADWLFNVEQFLSSGTDFYGLTLRNAWTSKCVAGIYADYMERRYRWSEGGVIVYGGGVFKNNLGSVLHLKRSLGLVSPTFYVRPWKPWGWRRTAAAASLLVQQLSRFR